MLTPTEDEISDAHSRARESIAIWADEGVPMTRGHDSAVAHALRLLLIEKEKVAASYWENRLRARWHGKAVRQIERRLGRPFAFDGMSEHVFETRWRITLDRFVYRDMERRFGREPVSLAEVRSAYRNEHLA